MRNILLFLFLAILGCSRTQTVDEAHIWLDADVQQKARYPEHELLLSRPPLKFASGSTVTSCQEYFQQGSDFIETAANYSARSHYQICDALKLIDHWPLDLATRKLDKELALCSSLNLASFSHSLQSPVGAKNVTMTSLFDGLAIDDRNSCTYQGEGRNFVLSAVLLTKQPNEPRRLWVWVTDEILDATYRAYLSIWFVFDESEKMWVAVNSQPI